MYNLVVIIVILLLYIIILLLQIRRINNILKKRLSEDTSQIVSIGMVNREINELAENINRCLKAEEKLRLNAMQEESDFKQMIASISHDLRTPLTAIKGYLHIIGKGDLNEEQLSELSIVKKHTEELEELVQHFFEYTYLLDAKPEVNLENINLSNLVIESVTDVANAIDEKNLEVEIQENTCVISADKLMTTRIVQNLIRNCIVHAEKKIMIFYTESEENNVKYVTLHVSNNVEEGTDIDVDKIFDRFYVGKKERKTTGLGLSIVKLLTTQMNGKVSANMNDGILDIAVSFVVSLT